MTEIRLKATCENIHEHIALTEEIDRLQQRLSDLKDRLKNQKILFDAYEGSFAMQVSGELYVVRVCEHELASLTKLSRVSDFIAETDAPEKIATEDDNP